MGSAGCMWKVLGWPWGLSRLARMAAFTFSTVLPSLRPRSGITRAEPRQNLPANRCGRPRSFVPEGEALVHDGIDTATRADPTRSSERLPDQPAHAQ